MPGHRSGHEPDAAAVVGGGPFVAGGVSTVTQLDETAVGDQTSDAAVGVAGVDQLTAEDDPRAGCRRQ